MGILVALGRLRLKCRTLLSVSAIAAYLPATPAIPQIDLLNAPLEIVRFGETDTLRDIVAEHLSDPDLWPNVLALNGIASPADLVPGVELKMPVMQVRAADNALLASLKAIQLATAEGARIFAPIEIGSAIENRDTAVLRREVGEWAQVVDFAGTATDYANEALDISIAQRDRSAEAVVSDVHGSVEGRAPAEPRWSGRELDDVLVEFERLRTLSDSTTQITFRDLSRLRLNPNSNATIQRMRSDPLTGGEVTKVSLVNGDFYALLNQLSDKTSFEIEVPGVETTTNSADFWIKNDRSGARFVNYDEPELEIVRGGDRIRLGENEGVVLTGARAERAEVLNAPRLSGPVLGDILYSGDVPLNWDDFDGAEAYWLEVAVDPGFNHMQVSEWGISDSAFLTTALPPARYFWRVAALDRLGLPGQWSKPRDFTVRVDTTPPFLTLLSPASGAMSSAPTIEILGATESDAILLLNGEALAVDRDGSFVTRLALAPGTNVIELLATDAAGNQTTRRHEVIYRPSAAVEITLADTIPRMMDALATRSADLSVFAQTNAQPGSDVVVRGADEMVVVRTEVQNDGTLTFTVPVLETPTSYRIEVLSPDGTVEGKAEFRALRDQVAPEITFDLPPPRATGEPVLELTGQVPEAVTLSLADRPIGLSDGRFEAVVDLAPGVNAFDLVATDAVGNVSVARLRTVYDIDPPDILRVDLGRPSGRFGPIEIEVEARDASGILQAAPYLIEVGGAEREGFLRCDATTGLCRASLPAEPGDLRLIEVSIEDYAGNVAFE